MNPGLILCLTALSLPSVPASEDGKATLQMLVVDSDSNPVPGAIVGAVPLVDGVPVGKREFRVANEDGAMSSWSGFSPEEFVSVELHEQPVATGTVLGMSRLSTIPPPDNSGAPVGLVEVTTQPLARIYVVDGKGENERRFGPLHPSPNAIVDVMLEESSTLQARFDIGVLHDESEVWAFWDYMGASAQGLLGSPGIIGGVVVKSDPIDFGQQQLALALPKGVADRAFSAFLLLDPDDVPEGEFGVVVTGYGSSSEPEAVFAIEGAMPAGYLALVWFDDKETHSAVLADPLLTDTPPKQAPGSDPVESPPQCYDCEIPEMTEAEKQLTSQCTPDMPGLGDPCPGDGVLKSKKNKIISIRVHEKCAAPAEKVEKTFKVKVTAGFSLAIGDLGVSASGELEHTIKFTWFGAQPCGTCRADYVLLRKVTHVWANKEDRWAPFSSPYFPSPFDMESCVKNSPVSATCYQWRDTFKDCARTTTPPPGN